VIEGARIRLAALRKKIYAAQQQQQQSAAKRVSVSGGTVTPKPTSTGSPVPTPMVAGTPPR